VRGCGSTGETEEAVERNIEEPIQFYLEGFREEGYETPEPSTMPLTCSLRWPNSLFKTLGTLSGSSGHMPRVDVSDATEGQFIQN
jgi:hypothetical protein